MRKLLLCSLLYTATLHAYSQDSSDIDLPVIASSMATEDTNKFWHKPKFVLGLMGHNSFIAGKKVHLGGVRVGLEFNQRWRFGLGRNYFNPPVHHQGGTEQDPKFYRVKFAYSNVFGEYIILNNRRWEISCPLVLGGGSTTIAVRENEVDAFVPYGSVRLTVMDLSAVGYYKIWKWLGLGASVGWRNVTSNDKTNPQLAATVTEAFDGPNWAIKTKIYLGALWKAVFKKKDKGKGKQKTIDQGTIDSQ